MNDVLCAIGRPEITDKTHTSDKWKDKEMHSLKRLKIRWRQSSSNICADCLDILPQKLCLCHTLCLLEMTHS